MERDEARPETPADGQPRGEAVAPTALVSARPPVGWWLALTVVALAVAIVKPWASEPPGSPTSGAVAEGRPLASGAAGSGPPPVPTLRPDSAGPQVATFCLDPQSWRLATIEHWRDQTIRVWRAIVPSLVATGPEDPTIPTFPIVSEGVTELGWCAPVIGPDRPVGLATLDVWRRSAAGPVAAQVTSTRATGAGASFGGLYLPPDNEEAAVWPDGGYVFRHREPSGRERWFAVEVELRPSTGTLDRG